MNKEVDWMIHYVFDEAPDKEHLANCHTHGLDKHNHRELCMVLALPQETVCGVLNSMGIRIAFEGKVFPEGIHTDILQGYNAEIYSLPDDPTLYLIVPDENNKLPSDEGCKFPYNMQYEYAKIISENKKNA